MHPKSFHHLGDLRYPNQKPGSPPLIFLFPNPHVQLITKSRQVLMIFLIYPLHLTASVLIQGAFVLGLMLLERSSVSMFPLKHLTADCTLGVGETVVSKTDMIPAFSDG